MLVCERASLVSSARPLLTIAFTTPGCGSLSAPMGLVGSATADVVTLQWQATPGASSYILEAGTSPVRATSAQSPPLAQLPSLAAPPGTSYVRVRASQRLRHVTAFGRSNGGAVSAPHRAWRAINSTVHGERAVGEIDVDGPIGSSRRLLRTYVLEVGSARRVRTSSLPPLAQRSSARRRRFYAGRLLRSGPSEERRWGRAAFKRGGSHRATVIVIAYSLVCGAHGDADNCNGQSMRRCKCRWGALCACGACKDRGYRRDANSHGLACRPSRLLVLPVQACSGVYPT